ncbi:hypothetical protein B0J11DRAFT_12611 [Dendryphion nanum]|uniref:Uncharacterized protein n=1 Tax=Dendryphion nanum TaxID=256645 RepID=A0A9P9IZX7_9PLEO|nr:hypothetical protein B0J11DRAFT_12611 [Dendryphion nanum]
MVANELEIQPDQGYTEIDCPSTPEYDGPEHKAGVYNDPMAGEQSRRYEKTDSVHMSQFINGIRRKGEFTIAKCHYNTSKSYWEYRLTDKLGQPYNNNAWVPERDLKRN